MKTTEPQTAITDEAVEQEASLIWKANGGKPVMYDASNTERKILLHAARYSLEQIRETRQLFEALSVDSSKQLMELKAMKLLYESNFQELLTYRVAMGAAVGPKLVTQIELEVARNEATKLREALEKYGVHGNGCPWKLIDKHCTCGLKEARE